MSPDVPFMISTILHWVVGFLLLAAVILFIRQYVIPGRRVAKMLRSVRESLENLQRNDQMLDLDKLRNEVMVDDALRHCWDEYRDTLHGQKQVNASGILEVSRWRATSLANSFFTEQTLIDSQMKVEFYKHLPGILTGLGIIGTFSGLIVGLQGFLVSDEADVVRRSLEMLLSSVGGAFMLSAIAITLAMLVTAIEKWIVNGLYIELEYLCGVIDSLFDAGAGVEYLQRLVEASETSATQAMQMKESLVTDLRQVLTELTQQQIATMTTTSQQLGNSITTSLAEGLVDPLAQISNAVQQVGSNQGEAVNRLLTDVLSNFTQQMQDMFGSQMRGMSDMLVQTANTIQQASQQFEQLAGQIQSAGAGAADAMAQRLDEGLRQMQARQTEANDQMRIFIDQLKESVARGQSESAEATMGMMRELGESTNALVQGLRDQALAAQQSHSNQQQEALERVNSLMGQLQTSMSDRQAQAEAATQSLVGQLGGAAVSLVQSLQEQAQKAQTEHEQRQAVLSAQSASLMEGQSEHIGRLADTVRKASESMQNAVDRLQAQTQTSIASLGQGAEKLYGASSRLGDNLDRMKANSDGLNDMAGKLNGSAESLRAALTAMQQVLGDQRQVRDGLMTLVGDLRETVELAKREASMSAGLVDSLQLASQRLTEAQRNAEAYLEGVTDVMSEAHGVFADQIRTTLREGNRAFHEELAQATSLLKGAIQDLGDVLDNLPTAA